MSNNVDNIHNNKSLVLDFPSTVLHLPLWSSAKVLSLVALLLRLLCSNQIYSTLCNTHANTREHTHTHLHIALTQGMLLLGSPDAEKIKRLKQNVHFSLLW